jgi:CubicO group peptidase (beta-lactamase class C family)
MILKYGNPKDVGMSEEKIYRLEALQQQWVEQGVSPVMISLVARKGIIVSHKLFVDPEYEKEYGRVTIDAIFPLASISKPVTSTAIMMLVEEGKVSVNLPVQDYIPEFVGENKDKVLVHHLLTHTSAIEEEKVWEILKSPDFNLDMSKCPNNLHPDIYKSLVAGCTVPLRTFPGKEMQYCNFGFTLLSEIIRRVTSKNLHEFATERIFQPLGMKDSYFIVPDDLANRVPTHPVNAPFPNFTNIKNLKKPWGSGGLCASVYDMAIFCQMMLNGGEYGGKRILNKLIVKKMTTNQLPGVSARFGEEFFKEASWGLGWNVSGNKQDYTGLLRSPSTFSHSGMGNTLIMVDPENEIITVNFQITMKRINNRAYHNFEYFNDAALACIE